MSDEGRSCPLAYRYQPERLCEDAGAVNEDVLYIVGGLYGNPYALDEIEQMALAEEQHGHRVRLVFNGDFNWFNASDELFREINSRVLNHTVSLGNVEYELANPSDGAGCGCAYPSFVDQHVVARSNRMMSRLQAVAENHPDLCRRLSLLPKYRCLMFGGLKILVLHGDPESLAGWGLAHEAFSAKKDCGLVGWFESTGADVIASTHTCLPVLWSGTVGGRARVVANNGSAGMANLAGDRCGLITRVARSSPATVPIAGVSAAGLSVSLLPVRFDFDAWLARFDALWPEASDAALSYRTRILGGTALTADRVSFIPGV
ncbi:MAG: hypothetical protein R6T87_13190 [Marinobacter sp.]